MIKKKKDQFSQREQQIMNLIYEAGETTATELQRLLPDPPSNSAIRVMLRILVEKKHLKKKQDGFRYIYYPAVGREKAKRSALNDVLNTFFGGSSRQAFVTLLDMSKSEMTDEDWEQIAALIEKNKRKGK